MPLAASPAPKPSCRRPVSVAEAFPGRRFLKVFEAAAFLEMPPEDVAELIQEETITAIDVSSSFSVKKDWRIPVLSFQAFVDARSLRE